MKVSIVLPFLFSLIAYSNTVIVNFPTEKLAPCNLSSTSDGISPRIPGAYPGDVEGNPSLPELPWAIPLAPGDRAASLTSSSVWETIAEDVVIRPLSAPTPLTITAEETAPIPSIEIYSTSTFWPSGPVQLTGNGFRNGLPQAEVLISPLRWNPITGELQQLVSLEINITTEPSTDRPLNSREQSDDFRRMLIVTDSSLEGVFEQLAQRRTDQGILAEVVTMDAVYAASSGRDDAEKLRNFVKDYYTVNGLDYLLLGGDTNLVPFRYAYAMTCEAGFDPREDSLPCDLYFSDLDGTWDANGNDIFGELADNVDLYPDIFVGRASVENLTEAESFIGRIAAYEDCYEEDFYQSVLFLADILWTNPYTNSGESKDYIEEHFLPGNLNITKLYMALGNENIYTTMAALNSGQNLINHDGHAWFSSLGVGDDYMSYADVDAINSYGRFSAVMYSIGCWSASFDYNAIAEHFITNPNGGSVAYVGNSSYGWGSPGNPLYGYSDALDHLFFDCLYADWSLTLGEILGSTKEYFIPYSQWENVYRWHQYDVNLLGDPSFRPYRANPQDVTIACPAFITENSTLFPVNISGVGPEGLTICLHDEGSYWSVTELNSTGYFNFDLPQPITGNLTLTVTGPGVKRTTLVIEDSTGPDPVVSELIINDSAGLAHLSPGASADLDLTLLNQGNEDLTNVELNITDTSGPATLISSSSSFGNIAAGEDASGSSSLSLTVNGSAATGEVVSLKGEIVSTEGSWEITIPLLVYAPGLYFTTYSIDDSAGGNNNGIPEPGELFQLDLNVSNLGLLVADAVSTELIDYPDWILIDPDSVWVASIPEDSTRTFSFNCELLTGAPVPSFPWIYLDISSETTGYTTVDTLRLTVGETGVSNDVEDGASGWTHSGSNDLWNITDENSHSPSHSWYCGYYGAYQNNMNCGLLSPVITLAPEATLEFWTQFDVAIYGSDGVHVILHNLSTTTSDTLDFIGSGGALGQGGKGNSAGWVPFFYDLQEVEAGTQIQIEFRFSSDNDGDTGLGFFIDDIFIQGAYTGSAGFMEGSSQPVSPMGYPYPNPSQGSINVHLFSDDLQGWTLGIYDLAGRRVQQINGASPVNSTVNINTSELAPGVYLIRFSAGTQTSRKLVVL